MNYEDIKKLIDDMGNSKLTEISIDFPDGTKIGMKKEVKVVEKLQEKNIQHIEQKEVNEIVETETQEDNCKIVKSPMVGTFYLKPDPNSNPYVEIGKKVKKGDILCTIYGKKQESIDIDKIFKISKNKPKKKESLIIEII